MRIGEKLAATAAVIGTAVLGGVVAAAPATAAPMDAGIHLTAGHDVGVYGKDVYPVDSNKIAPNLLYPSRPGIPTDGIDADCYTSKGSAVNGHDNRWYHTVYLYYNHNGGSCRSTRGSTRPTWTTAPQPTSTSSLIASTSPRVERTAHAEVTASELCPFCPTFPVDTTKLAPHDPPARYSR